MIDIQFKACCNACPNIDVDYNQTREFGEVVSVIGCAYACVCGVYNAEKAEAESAPDVIVKGFNNAD